MDEKALGFELFRYTKMDQECQREWDIRFKLNMAQIKYIHTHRFQSELVAYFLHFHQLQELVNHYRAAVIGKGHYNFFLKLFESLVLICKKAKLRLSWAVGLESNLKLLLKIRR